MKRGNPKSQIIIYKTEDGQTKIDVRFEGETTKQNISQHIKNIFDDNELRQESTVKKFFTVAASLRGAKRRSNPEYLQRTWIPDQVGNDRKE